METAIQTITRSCGRANVLPQSGAIVEVSANGSPLVEYNGNELGPIPARTIIQSARQGDLVLLVFDQGNPALPIIIGVLHDRFEQDRTQRIRLTAKEILLEGADEVSLRCGDSSLTLRKDGKTLLKGREVLSRASRTNRIRGATVQIN